MLLLSLFIIGCGVSSEAEQIAKRTRENVKNTESYVDKKAKEFNKNISNENYRI